MRQYLLSLVTLGSLSAMATDFGFEVESRLLKGTKQSSSERSAPITLQPYANLNNAINADKFYPDLTFYKDAGYPYISHQTPIMSLKAFARTSVGPCLLQFNAALPLGSVTMVDDRGMKNSVNSELFQHLTQKRTPEYAVSVVALYNLGKLPFFEKPLRIGTEARFEHHKITNEGYLTFHADGDADEAYAINEQNAHNTEFLYGLSASLKLSENMDLTFGSLVMQPKAYQVTLATPVKANLAQFVGTAGDTKVDIPGLINKIRFHYNYLSTTYSF